jgi:tryptophan-rich hypothetical protein
MAKKQKFPHLLGSKWTARQKILGWRHFQVVNRQNQGPLVFAEMVAACDPEMRLWVNAKTLKNHTLWRGGWQSSAGTGGDRGHQRVHVMDNPVPRHSPTVPHQVIEL